MMPYSSHFVVAAAFASMAMLPARAGNLVKDASFEKPVVPDGTYQSFSTGDSFKNWTVVGEPGNVAIVNQDFTYCAHTFPAKKGVQFVDLTYNSKFPNLAAGATLYGNLRPGFFAGASLGEVRTAAVVSASDANATVSAMVLTKSFFMMELI